MASDYRPIPCALHSDYERLAMANAPVRARWRNVAGQLRETVGRVADVRTRHGEEFLHLAQDDGQTVQIRLDRIERIERRQLD